MNGEGLGPGSLCRDIVRRAICVHCAVSQQAKEEVRLEMLQPQRDDMKRDHDVKQQPLLPLTPSTVGISLN